MPKPKPTRAPAIFCAHDKLVAVADLKPHPRNPNKHPAEQLRLFGKIIRANGWRRPIVVSKRSGCIVKGHGAWLAAQREGFKLAPVNFQDYATAEAELQDMLADNELARLAETDEAELQKLLAELEAAGEDPELAGLLKELEATDAPPQIDNKLELQKKWGTKLGQLWSLGDHELLCGDSTNTDFQPPKPFSVVSDPPFELSLGDLVKALFVPAADDYMIMLSGHRVFELEAASGCKLHNDFVINRPAFLMVNNHVPTRTHFYWLDFSRAGSSRFDRGGGFFPSLQTWDWANRETEHSFEKPIEGVVEMLKHYPLAMTILDPFSGSGTILIACENLGRRCRAIELDPGYVAVALQRWSDLTGKTPKLKKPTKTPQKK